MALRHPTQKSDDGRMWDVLIRPKAPVASAVASFLPSADVQNFNNKGLSLSRCFALVVWSWAGWVSTPRSLYQTVDPQVVFDAMLIAMMAACVVVKMGGSGVEYLT
jgi:hypothetical protein